ncbi:peroxidase-like [Pectinophora gossypiella]|nr:peroxidase-like [Pectinophora gossypiella]
MLLILLLMFCDISLGNRKFYDTYSGKPITMEELRTHDKQNNTFWCAIEVADCNPKEGRRLDGTCNNLKHLTRGATHTPFYRVLPAVYGDNFEPRKSVTGQDLPLARLVRTTLLAEGKVPDQIFTQLLTYYWVFMSSDIAALHDTVNYIEWIPFCCTEKGKTEYMCTPNKVPIDDPVHRFSGIRCLNMTRPVSFQTSGCIANNTSPERINTATPIMDLSNVYGSVLNGSLRARTFKGGLLKEEVENGRVWPPSVPIGVCRLNQRPAETRCHGTPDDVTNTLAGINLVATWFWRQHNKIARKLAKINPCWSDNRLFYTARDINIASALQIYMYELLPAVMGRENLIVDNVINGGLGFRDFYDPTVKPQLSLEYPYALRWTHLIQESTIKMYDSKGHYVKQFPMVNLTLRTGYFAVDNNIDYITQGAFRQPSAKFDYIVDPDMTGIGLGPHQRSTDILTNDLAKGRYFGFPPYVEYRKLCSGLRYKTWKDLKPIINPEHLEKLQELYKNVEDIDLMAGMWVEKYIPGGFVPQTFYCLIIDQLRRNMVVDRHFFERPTRPNAFTFQQLLEIRKATIAQVLCDVGDTVTEIQPHAFFRQSLGNEMRSCDQIEKVNLNAWKDISCHYNPGKVEIPTLYS